jgi:hypothetical protein
MGAINIGNGHLPWVVARWAFQGYLDFVLEEVLDDEVLTYVVEEALALDGLHLPLTDATIVQRLGPVLIRVADEVMSGARPARVVGRVLDDASQAQFRQAVAELRCMLATLCSS